MPNLKESPSQTAGPYVHIGCVPSFAGLEGMYDGDDLGSEMITGNSVQGTRITLRGHVYDGANTLLLDAMLEIWQADANGLFHSLEETRGKADPAFTGWGRQPTDGATGEYKFETIKPGRTLWPDGRMQAPHISVWVVARGINLGLHTRVYFEEEYQVNAEDPLLGQIELKSRLPTLISKREGSVYRFDIHLQGPQETVFFDV